MPTVDRNLRGCYLLIAIPGVIVFIITIVSMIREKSGIDDVPQKIEISKLDELDTRNSMPVIVEGYVIQGKEDYNSKHYLTVNIGDTSIKNQAELCENSLFEFKTELTSIIEKKQRVKITGRYYQKCVHVNKIEDPVTNTVIRERK